MEWFRVEFRPLGEEGDWWAIWQERNNLYDRPGVDFITLAEVRDAIAEIKESDSEYRVYRIKLDLVNPEEI